MRHPRVRLVGLHLGGSSCANRRGWIDHTHTSVKISTEIQSVRQGGFEAEKPDVQIYDIPAQKFPAIFPKDSPLSTRLHPYTFCCKLENRFVSSTKRDYASKFWTKCRATYHHASIKVAVAGERAQSSFDVVFSAVLRPTKINRYKSEQNPIDNAAVSNEDEMTSWITGKAITGLCREEMENGSETNSIGILRKHRRNLTKEPGNEAETTVEKHHAFNIHHRTDEPPRC
ncbi:hypothetical protein T01_4914 [Trichinella spiralis]|uniref:Uncharacterized protein n=1 Tax=Trichinella spiralis TaxID=6334 RepID=A0A0V1AWN9_TRISP|nr:hypothetical protein T01_4914 [Trichinella spiralis]